MFDQLAGRQLPVRRQFIGRAGEIFHDCLLLFAQIGMAQLRAHFLGFDLTQAGVDGNARDPVLEGHFARELGKLLKNFDENHLAKILFTSSSRSMRADHFRDKRIKTANQFASRRIVMAQRALNQRICVRIIHVVVEAVSTLPIMTGVAGWWLQVSWPEADKIKCNQRGWGAVTTYETVLTIQMKTNMKRNLLTFTAIGAIALAGYAFAQSQNGFGGHHGGWHGQGLAMGHLTKALNLTAEQQSKVQPLIDQARPQIVAIHKDAMQKTQAVIDKTMSQVRPLLTSDQQTKFDALQKARQDMRNAMQEMHAAMAQ